MKRSITLICCLAVSTSISIAAPIKALPLIKAKVKPETISHICHLLKPNCQGDNVYLWHVKNRSNNTYYLIDAKPRFIQLTKTANDYKITTIWDFETFSHSNTAPLEEDLNPTERSIYPALYPLAKNQFAVTILNNWWTGYSGGGAGESYADFVQLNSDGSFQTAFKNIPFSASRMIRACFTEEDYKKNSHCHDEKWITLYIHFKDIGHTYYQWQFTYNYFNWNAFKSKNTTTVKQIKNIAMPFN